MCSADGTQMSTKSFRCCSQLGLSNHSLSTPQRRVVVPSDRCTQHGSWRRSVSPAYPPAGAAELPADEDATFVRNVSRSSSSSGAFVD